MRVTYVIDDDILMRLCKELDITLPKLTTLKGRGVPAPTAGNLSFASYYPTYDEIVFWVDNIPEQGIIDGDELEGTALMVNIILHELRHAWQRKHHKVRFLIDAYINRFLFALKAKNLRALWYQVCWIEKDARNWTRDNLERYSDLVDKEQKV